MGRLIAGLVMLAALLLFAPSASAHGAGHATEPSGGRPSVAFAVTSVSAGQTPADDGSRDCVCCCVIGQCAMGTIALPTRAAATRSPTLAAAAYAEPVAAQMRGLGAGPTTPPPRLDA